MNQYKLIFKKIIISMILLVTFGVTYLIYGDTYNLTADSDKLAHAINNYIFSDDVNAEIQFIHKEKDWMYVIITDRQYGNNFKGIIRLKRGWNGKYVLYDADYGTGYPVSRFNLRGNNSKIVFYGLIPDNRAKCYEFISIGTFSKGKVEFSGDITQKAFVQMYDNVNDDLLRLKLYDTAGNDITESYSTENINNAPTAAVSTAELFVVDIVCGFIIFLGFLIAFVCWHK